MLKFRRRITLRILDRGSMERVHLSSLEVLEKVGMEFHSDSAVKALENAGCEVDGSWVRFPEHLVREAIKKAPKRFKLCARDPALDLDLDGEQTYIFTNGTCTHVIDLDTGQRRRAVKDDLIRTARLADALEGIHGYYTFVIPSDKPSYAHGIHELEAALKNTKKHVMLGSTSSREEARFQISMARAVTGEELGRRPLISAVICLTPPLRIDGQAAEAAMEFAKAGVPIRGMSMPLMGISSPITQAGALSVANAELLGLLTLVQVVSPGAPFIYAIDPMAMEPRGNFAPCLPAGILVGAAGAQLGRKFYGIPSGDGYTTASKVPDGQAAYEVALMAFTAMAAGADLMSGPGSLECYNTLSYEQFLIDYEVMREIYTVLEGFEVDGDSLATETVVKRAREGMFVSDRHTLNRLGSLWSPFIANFDSYDKWAKNGGKDAAVRAREKVKEILRTHEPEPLPIDVEEEVDRLLMEGERVLAEVLR